MRTNYSVKIQFLKFLFQNRYVADFEYPYSIYPPYCAGAFYLMKFNVMLKLIQLFEQEFHRNYLWIEDVFLTGMQIHNFGNFRKSKFDFNFYS